MFDGYGDVKIVLRYDVFFVIFSNDECNVQCGPEKVRRAEGAKRGICRN